MNPENFKNSTAGKCTRTIREPSYWAYVPHALPPKIEMDWDLANLLSTADIKLGELSGAGQLLLNPHLLIGPFVRREAVMSSRIENTQSGLDDLFLFEADESEPPTVADMKEIINYIVAMEHGIKQSQELPIGHRLICEIHGILMKGVRGEHATPVLMRTSQNWIGGPECRSLMDATYVPPPVPEMKECFSDLEKYIHSNAKEPPLIQCALVHYQFEAIHPFVDGNGRIGRLLITFMLMQKKLLSQPLLYLSDFFEQHRDEYYELLLNVSQKGDWKAWLTFFLNGARQQSEDAVATVQKSIALQNRYRALATGRKVPKVVNRLIDYLFANPYISVSQLSKTWKMPFPTVQRGVDYLIEKDILGEITGGRRNRLFVAHEIFNTIMTERTKSLNPRKHLT